MSTRAGYHQLKPSQAPLAWQVQEAHKARVALVVVVATMAVVGIVAVAMCLWERGVTHTVLSHG